jgi:hypothetical protein
MDMKVSGVRAAVLALVVLGACDANHAAAPPQAPPEPAAVVSVPPPSTSAQAPTSSAQAPASSAQAAASSAQAPARACTATTSLPPRAKENQDLVNALAINVSNGLRLGDCAAMLARDPSGPPDVWGRATTIRCGPPRVCSAGEDGKPNDADDACATLDAKTAGSSPRRARALSDAAARNASLTRVETRFLVVDPNARPGCSTADAAIVQFYASFMRGDDVYEEVLPPRDARSQRLSRKLEKMGTFRLYGVRLDELACTENSCRFGLYFDVGARDAPATAPHQTGTDQGEVERVGDRWVVTQPPT